MQARIEVYGFPGELFRETLKWFALKLDSQNIEVIYADSWGSGTAVLIISSDEIPMLIRVNFTKLIREQDINAVIRFVNSQPFMSLRIDPVSPQIPAYLA